MKILNCCYSDYANYSYCNARALQAVGIDAKAISLTRHSFGYTEQAECTTEKDMLEQMREADVIQIMHTCPTTYDLVRKLDAINKPVKPLFVYHTGTRYRQEPDKYNQLFNPIIERALTDQTEFMHLGGKDIAYVAVAIDTDKIYPRIKQPGNKLIIGHYPSKSQVKGTERIIKMLQPYWDLFDIRWDVKLVPHEENLKRIQECDIYVELFSPLQGEKEYGCFGVTAFEAAAMGKIVVTQNLYKEVYRKVYGECVFLTPGNSDLFAKDIEFLAKTPDIKGMQNLHRDWMVKKHGYKATGERLKTLLGI